MLYAYDLHIHSCLSPCGSLDMTPNNIVNMSKIKGLDIIAVTDHNACDHVRTVYELGQQLEILVLPGMEVQTKEEVHILCYFESVDAIEAFDVALNPFKSKIPNNIKVFGHQSVLNAEDAFVKEVEHALILSVDLGLEELQTLVRQYQGIMVPAHINKSANSLLVQLGFIPPELQFGTIEVYQKTRLDEKIALKYQKLYNSDAHYLEHISEAEHHLELPEKTCKALIQYLSGKG